MCANPECSNTVIRSLGLCSPCYYRFRENGSFAYKRKKGHDYRNWKEHLLKERGAGVARAYSSWVEMRKRVKHPVGKSACYSTISIDDPRWDDFETFSADMGECPEGMSIDRIDSTKGYYLENCRWADAITQSRNRTYVKLSVELAEEIRRIYRDGGTSQRKLADKYGVTQVLISQIIRGIAWREISSSETGWS